MRWEAVRDEVWQVVEPRIRVTHTEQVRVAIVGGGSCDDVPVARIAATGATVDLIDIDPDAMARGRKRVPRRERHRVSMLCQDVTDGAADAVVEAVRCGVDTQAPNPARSAGQPLGHGEYDLVIGDMLYTQLLHPALVASGRPVSEQTAAMRRFDGPLVEALVHRLHASVAAGGVVLHIADIACWSADHPQPLTLESALHDPPAAWAKLTRHDGCDPALVVERFGLRPVETAWWEWPFEPNKRFLVRGMLVQPR